MPLDRLSGAEPSSWSETGPDAAAQQDQQLPSPHAAGSADANERSLEPDATRCSRDRAQGSNQQQAQDLRSAAAAGDIPTAAPLAAAPQQHSPASEQTRHPHDHRHAPQLFCTTTRHGVPAAAEAASDTHHQRRPSTPLDSWSNLAGSPRHTNILKEDLARQSLAVPRGGIAQAVCDHIQQSQEPIASGLNLRDAAGTSPDTIRLALVYRSSQVFRAAELVHLQLTSALDLREEPRACRKAAEKTVATGFAVAPLKLLPDRFRLHAHRSLPAPCHLCSGTGASAGGDPNLYQTSLQVFHVDLLPSRLKLQIFVDMPWRIRLATLAAPLQGKSPKQVMTPAVADPSKLGYLKLYKMMLDMSMPQIARALRVFAFPENLPVVVHCIHGKDRTGLVIALLLLTLGVPEEVVVLDYAKSEVELKGGRDTGRVQGALQDWLVTDDVVASSAQTMEDTLHYLDSRYGGIRRYLRIIGITHGEVHAIRKNLLQPQLAGSGGVPPLGTLSAFSMSTEAGFGNDHIPRAQAATMQSTPTGKVQPGSCCRQFWRRWGCLPRSFRKITIGFDHFIRPTARGRRDARSAASATANKGR